MSAKDRGLGGFDLPERRRERGAAALRSATSAAREPEPATPTSTTSDAAAPLPPPRRRRQVRVQLNTRLNYDLHERLQRFVTDHDAAVQDVVETALAEYLDRRGR